MQLIATCAFGLEKLVYDEIKALGLWVIKNEDGRVTFEGDEEALIKANLWLRCADRVLIKIDEFEAKTFDELFDQTNQLEWEKYIEANDAFPIKATSVKSALHSEPAIQSIIKKAVVKRLQKQYKLETLAENSGASYQIIIKANKDHFLVAIDSSGESLHKRGYRTRANLAPIKETLAAAMVKLSDWTLEKTLIDPFCGSGTIGIEAALMACNIAPGLNRTFAFQRWPWLIKENFIKIHNETKAGIKTIAKLPIYCFDIDAEVLKIAAVNAKNAGFNNLHFKRADFRQLNFSQFLNCTFITNPPYGERMGEKAEIENMYRELGTQFAKTKNSSLFLITSHENFPTLCGYKANKNRKL